MVSLTLEMVNIGFTQGLFNALKKGLILSLCDLKGLQPKGWQSGCLRLDMEVKINGYKRVLEYFSHSRFRVEHGFICGNGGIRTQNLRTERDDATDCANGSDTVNDFICKGFQWSLGIPSALLS